MTRSTSYTAMLLLIALGLPAVAAENSEQGKSERIEEIVVTGTRIKRLDYFSASPLHTLDRATLEATGTTDLMNVLTEMPFAHGGPGAGTHNVFSGRARFNLRAIGDHRSLKLLNGRRLPTDRFGGMDLNKIPPVMIDRVEIVTGGASAVYGSDAIAGAINFILRNDYEGFQASAQYEITEHGDADVSNLDLAFGTPFADGRGHVSVFGNYMDRSTVFQDARKFSQAPLTTDFDTGEIRPGGSFASPFGGIDGRLGVDWYTFNDDGTPRLVVDPDDLYNTAANNVLQAPMSRFSANLLGRYDVRGRLRVNLELNYAYSTPEAVRDDAFFGFTDVNVDRPDITVELRDLLASRYDPDGDGIATIFLLRRLTPERGQGSISIDRDFYRAVIGAEGDLGERWHWSVDVVYSSTEATSRIVNDSSISRLRQGMLVDPSTGSCFDSSGGCVPVNPFGAGSLTAAAADFIALTGSGSRDDSEQQMLNATVRGPVLSLWAGELETAFGVEIRRDEISYRPNEANADSVFGLPVDIASAGVHRVKEAYAEARIPLAAEVAWADQLAIEVGVRVSNHDTLADDVWTWKAGAEWQVLEDFRFRAMRQRAVRSPNVSETFSETLVVGTSFSLGLFLDQCSASRDPIGNGLRDLCIAQGLPPDQVGVFEAGFSPTTLSFGPGPGLDPEESDSITAGIVWTSEPWNLSASLDYFEIEIDNVINFVQAPTSTTVCFASRDPTSPFCQLFKRGPDGNIATVTLSLLNVSQSRHRGFDFSLDYTWTTDALALFSDDSSLTLSVFATHYLEGGIKNSPLVPFVDCAGKFGPQCMDFMFKGSLADFKSTVRVTYRSGPFSAVLAWRHIASMKNNENEFFNNQPPLDLEVARTPAVNYLDLSIRQALGRNVELGLGIINLTDRQPPFLGAWSSAANTDPATFDVLGRRFFLRITARL